MKKISILYFGKINSLTGVSSVLKNIEIGFKNIPEYDLKIFSLDVNGKAKPENFNKPLHKKSLIKQNIHFFLNKMSKSSAFIARFYAWLTYDRNAKNVVAKKGENLKDADILFFHDFFTPFYFRKKFREIWNSKPKIVVLHSNGEILKMLFDQNPKLEQNEKSRHFYNCMGETVIEEAQALVFLSEGAASNFLNLYSQYKEKVFVVPNGLPDLGKTKFLSKSDSEKIRIVTVGTVCMRKGHDIIVDAMISLDFELRQNYELYVIGDGPLLDVLKEKCDKNNINNIIFVGASKEVDKYLSNADVFLLASRDEGLPMAIIEALRCKLPIIGTKVGGIPDMINEKNGWLIYPSLEELVVVFEELISRKKDIELMGEESYHIFKKRFSIEKMVSSYIDVFEKIEV
jgi:glycosyltransferase involved in cell wall biosynthesis